MNAWFALALATTVLVLIPGPNVALVVANTLHGGLRSGTMTVVGTTAGVALQLALVIAGLAALVEATANALVWIRWIGVVYLVYLGIRTWRMPPRSLSIDAAAPPSFWPGVTIAALNPKTLLFNAAFIPQFVGDAGGGELIAAASVYLAVLFVGDLVWMLLARSASRFLVRWGAWRNRISGAFLTVAGVGLAAVQRN